MFENVLPAPNGAEAMSDYIARCYINKNIRRRNRRMLALVLIGVGLFFIIIAR